MDKKIYNKVRLRLLKQLRIRDLLKVSSKGYSITRPKDGKFIFEVSKKNISKDGVKLELGVNDSEMGYELLNIMHNRGFYGKINEDNKYPVTFYESTSEYGDVKVMLPRVDMELRDISNYLRYTNDLGYLIDKEWRGSKVVGEYTFKSLDDYKQFLRERHRVIGGDYNKNEMLKNLKRELEDEIKDKQEQLENINKELKE